MVQHFKKNQEKRKGAGIEIEKTKPEFQSTSYTKTKDKESRPANSRVKKDVSLTNVWSDDETHTVRVAKDKPSKTTTTDANHMKSIRDGTFKAVEQIIKTTAKAEYRPFRVQQYNLAREDTESEESEQDWAPAKLKSVKKPITINIKLPGSQNPNIVDPNNKEHMGNDEDAAIKQKRRKRKKKKSKKDGEDSGISLETLGKTLKRCRDKISISEDKSTDITTSVKPIDQSTALQLVPGTSGTTLNTQKQVEPAISSSQNISTFSTPNPAWYAMSNSAIRYPNRTPTAMPSRGYNYQYAYHNAAMIRSAAMRYPMHPTMLRHMQASFMALQPPPLPEDGKC